MPSTDRVTRLGRVQVDQILLNVSWRFAPPVGDEFIRWAGSDGSWISISFADDVEMNRVVIVDSAGRHEQADSYERALVVARSWRAKRART